MKANDNLIPETIINLTDEVATKVEEPVVRAWLDWKLQRLNDDLLLERDLNGDPDGLLANVTGGLMSLLGHLDDPARREEFIEYCEERCG